MVKRITILFLILSLISDTYGQLSSPGVKIKDDLRTKRTFSRRSTTKPTQCISDTVEYPRYKTTAYNTISMRKNQSLGQFYPTPQEITVYGFEFYAWALVPTPPAQKKINIICNLYKAGADSLPSGSPLRSDTITVDTTFGGGVLTKIRQMATFSSPISLNYPYIITVESDSLTANVGVVSNSWASKNGKGENLLCGSVSGKWYRGLNLNIGGVQLDADMILNPVVKYTFGTDYKSNYTCYPLTDTVRFTNQSKYNVCGSKFYNYYTYYNIERYCHRWNYGDNFNEYNEINAKKKYTTKGNYKVRLISFVYQWRGDICYDTFVTTIYYKPDAPTISGPAFMCSGDTASFKAIGDPGSSVTWHRSKSDTGFIKGNIYNTGVLVKNDTTYIKATNNMCVSSFRNNFLNVYEYPNVPTVKNDSVCSGSIANLQANSNLGSINWFRNTTGGSFFYSGNVFQTDNLFADTSYYVEANNKGCISKPRVEVKALVGANFAPTPPAMGKDTSICLRPTATIYLQALSSGGNTTRWFDVAAGGVPISTGPTLAFTPSVRGDKYFYADAYNGVCASSRLPIKIEVNDFPDISTYKGDTTCAGDTLNLEAYSKFGTINWFDTAIAGSSIFSGNIYNPGIMSKSKNYFVETSENGCVSTSRTLLKATVNTYPVATGLNAPTICAKAVTTLTASVGFGKINWYDDNIKTTLLATGTTFKTPQLLGTTTYFIQTENAGCTSPLIPVKVTVNPRPVSGFTYELRWNKKLLLNAIQPNGNTFVWDFGDGATTSGPNVLHTYTTANTYKVRQIAKSNVNGCTDTTDIDILVDHTDIKGVVNQQFSTTIYPNPSNGKETFVLMNSLFTGNASIKVVSVEGKSIFYDKVKVVGGSNSFLLKSIHSAGIYFVIIEMNGLKTSSKLIVQ